MRPGGNKCLELTVDKTFCFWLRKWPLRVFDFIFSDHDFIQEQETRLLMMCKRTMALPVGRFVCFET